GNKNRLERFRGHRAELAKQVKLYAAACKESNKDAAYKVLPTLHESFEAAAAELLPIPYPEIEAIYITSGLIVAEHLPNKSTEGIAGSTATILRKIEYLTEESIPAELAEHKSELLKEFAQLKKLAKQMNETSDAPDMQVYQGHAEELNRRLEQIIAIHL
ncbi:MAG: hypothetical protein KJ589_17240, partial [Proteobacteria bacterium]|nr:hypothetical protein [Pseudomonadota bacterium]